MLKLNSHEAVTAFAAWLTTRDEPITMGAANDCAPVANVVKAFAESQSLPPVRDDFADRISPYPNSAGA